MEIIRGIIYGIIAQILAFLQLQGSIKYGLYEKYMLPILLLSVPISWIFMKSVNNFITAFDGEIWPSRLIGFGIGIIVFSLMSHFLFKEPITTKTFVCLCLGIAIILIQVLWKS
jgi:hypothetical protein